jgi:GNAT superfamily N-acetyltransferase
MSSNLAIADRTDVDWIADLISAAFHDLPVSQWLVPDPEQRSRIMPGNFAIHVEQGVDHGEVHVTTDRSAVAVWVPRGWAPLPPPGDYDQRLAAVCGEWTDRFRHLDEVFAKHTPAPAHHYLALLAVRPDRQGNGLGSQILGHYHARLDRANMAAFLEASGPRARTLYLRHGYRDLGDPYEIGDGARLWPMWREPRGRAAAAPGGV